MSPTHACSVVHHAANLNLQDNTQVFVTLETPGTAEELKPDHDFGASPKPVLAD